MSPVRALLLAVILVVCESALAVPVNLYHSPADDGSGGDFEPVFPSDPVVNIWLDAGETTFGFTNVELALTGNGGAALVSFECTQPCLLGTVVPGVNGTVLLNAGDGLNGNPTRFRVGTMVLDLTVPGGPWFVEVLGGLYLDSDLIQQELDRDLIALPEPGAATLLLLGVLGVFGPLSPGPRRRSSLRSRPARSFGAGW